MAHVHELTQLALTAFVTITVVIDPIGLIPLVVGYTRHHDAPRRRAICRKALFTGLAVTLLFFVCGHALLAYLGISISAFTISGGILLFVTAFPMLFGKRGGLQSSGTADADDDVGDVAIFPLAIPLIAGPCTLTTVMLFAAQANGDPYRVAVVTSALLAAFVVTAGCLWFGTPLLRLIGDDGINMVTRLLGLVLAALAVQFVLNGLTTFVTTQRPTALTSVRQPLAAAHGPNQPPARKPKNTPALKPRKP